MNTTIEEIQSILGAIYIQLIITQKENERLKRELVELKEESKNAKV